MTLLLLLTIREDDLLEELDGAGGVLDRSRNGLRPVLVLVVVVLLLVVVVLPPPGPWGVELAVDSDRDTVHLSISVKISKEKSL